jgi:hypothetical protein
MLHEDGCDFESRYVLGWLHLYRYNALPAGQHQQDYDAAMELFMQCFVAGVDGLPESLRPALARRAVLAADPLIDEAMSSPDRELAITAVGLWRRIVDATPSMVRPGGPGLPSWSSPVPWRSARAASPPATSPT